MLSSIIFLSQVNYAQAVVFHVMRLITSGSLSSFAKQTGYNSGSQPSVRFLVSCLLLAITVLRVRVELVQLRSRETFAAQNVGLDPVRHYGAHLVVHMSACRNAKDIVEF